MYFLKEYSAWTICLFAKLQLLSGYEPTRNVATTENEYKAVTKEKIIPEKSAVA